MQVFKLCIRAYPPLKCRGLKERRNMAMMGVMSTDTMGKLGKIGTTLYMIMGVQSMILLRG